MEKTQKVLRCYFCGNETLMNLVGEHKYNWDEGDGYLGYFNYQMFSCPVCGRVTLHEQYWDVTQQTFGRRSEVEDYLEEQILYPINSFKGDSLPIEVQKAYESALKTKNIDSAICLIALRRTLEIVCKEKDAKGHSLWEKIRDLSKKGVLPAELKHASDITKTYGNMGAHESDIRISHQELNQIIEFVQYILDYLYILPSKLNRIQERLHQKPTNIEIKEEESLHEATI